MTWLTQWLSGGAAAAIAWSVVLLLIVLGIGAGLIWRRRTRGGIFMPSGRRRQPRLSVVDATAIDHRRRLVLVRRDGVEHLILIGGGSDMIIETDIEPARAEVDAQVAVTPQPVGEERSNGSDVPSDVTPELQWPAAEDTQPTAAQAAPTVATTGMVATALGTLEDDIGATMRRPDEDIAVAGDADAVPADDEASTVFEEAVRPDATEIAPAEPPTVDPPRSEEPETEITSADPEPAPTAGDDHGAAGEIPEPAMANVTPLTSPTRAEASEPAADGQQTPDEDRQPQTFGDEPASPDAEPAAAETDGPGQTPAGPAQAEPDDLETEMERLLDQLVVASRGKG